MTNEKLYLGVELGSTRIKSVLINGTGEIKASGSHTWENKLNDGYWSYSEAAIGLGFKESVQNLVKNYGGVPKIKAMGVSAMMHGYIALDKDGNLLTPFRTWRNTSAAEAATKLTELFGVHIPTRWSISHLYQAILNEEEHVKDIAHITTLAGYVHYKLTGKFVLGAGDASGVFPIDSVLKDYNHELLEKFDNLIADRSFTWRIRDILPSVAFAGEDAGSLTEKGTEYLGADFSVGIKLAAPEGDAGTGMAATNSIKVGTGNISAGTSTFAMVVMDKELKKLYMEIDPITTPDGKPVSMVHCNNCTSDINAWGNMLREFANELGIGITLPQALDYMFFASKKAEGKLADFINYNFISSEPIAKVTDGVPLFLRKRDAKLSFADFSKAQIFSCVTGLAIGMEILYNEGVKVSKIFGHGGFFKTADIGQRALSAAIGTPVSVMETACEGGAWGMALLAAVTDNGLSLEEFLNKIFENQTAKTITATTDERNEFSEYFSQYKKCLAAEREAARNI